MYIVFHVNLRSNSIYTNIVQPLQGCTVQTTFAFHSKLLCLLYCFFISFVCVCVCVWYCTVCGSQRQIVKTGSLCTMGFMRPNMLSSAFTLWTIWPLHCNFWKALLIQLSNIKFRLYYILNICLSNIITTLHTYEIFEGLGIKRRSWFLLL